MAVKRSSAQIALGDVAPDIPHSRVSARQLLALMLPASTAMYMVYQGVVQVLLPAQIEAIDPAAKVENFAFVSVFAAFTAAIGIVAGGAMSDKTPEAIGRWGKRSPWLIISAVCSAIVLFLMAAQETILAVGVCYMALWFTMNFYQGALTAVLPDRIPERMRGVASSVMGLGLPFGILLGVNLVARVDASIAYASLALAMLVTMIVFVALNGEQTVTKSASPVVVNPAIPNSVGMLDPEKNERAFFSSFASSDFTYAFIGRMLMFLAFFTVTGYQFFMLQDYIGVSALPDNSPQIAMGILGTVQTTAWILAISIAGWAADKLDRRKLFVGVCSIGMAFAMFIPIFSATWEAMLLFQVFLGIFFGIFMSVDVALISLVLPDEEAAGRDMGLLSIAGLPAVAATVIAATLVKTIGYEAIFVFGFVTSLLGGLVVFKIRSVK